jgi:hypothetical protein
MKNTWRLLPDQVPVAGLGVELHREAARVAQRLGRVAAVDDAREAAEHGRALAAPLNTRARVYRSTGSSPTRPYVSK